MSTTDAIAATADRSVTDVVNDDDVVDDDILVDDDGYCEIDELRLPTVLSGAGVSFMPASATNATPTTTTVVGTSSSASPATIPDLKRQSTISADSIPEETEHEMHAEAGGATAEQLAAAAPEQSPLCSNSHIEINDTYDTTSGQISECAIDSGPCDPIDVTTVAAEITVNAGGVCGTNRLAHVTSLAPAVPCHLISNYVTALSSQISLLLVSV